MATTGQNKEFSEQILEQWPLDIAVDYIANSMDPEDVFTDSQLDTWAVDNGYEKE